jgi:IS30 family transposase
LKRFKQLDLRERERLYALIEQGLSFREIGRQLNRPHTTFSREYERNRRPEGAYIPCSAHTYAHNRLHKQRSEARRKSEEIYIYIQNKLKLHWSPETIAGRLPRDLPGNHIHFETIYRFIYWKRIDLHLWHYLILRRPHRMKKLGRRVKRGRPITDGIRIDKRPMEVTQRGVPT